MRKYFLGLVAGLAATVHADSIVSRLVTPSQAAAVAATYGISVADTTDPSPFVLFAVPANRDIHAIETAMQSDSRVVWAEDQSGFEFPEYQSSTGGSVAAIFDPSATFAVNRNVWTQIHFSGPFSKITRSILIGIVDTGLSPYQKDLTKRVMASANFAPTGLNTWDLPFGVDSNGNGILDEAAGHGTMVTGIVAQLAPAARFVISRVADSDGHASTWTLIKGISFAVQRRCRLINVSLGSMDRLTAMSDVVDWTEQQGVLIISPVGNNNANSSMFPARYSNVVCVSGLLPDNHKAPFSNYDSAADVAAPATGIQSAWYDGQSAVWSGTSFAAPIVTGCLADSLAVIRAIPTPADIRTALDLSGTSIDSINHNFSGKLGKLMNGDAFYKTIGYLH